MSEPKPDEPTPRPWEYRNKRSSKTDYLIEGSSDVNPKDVWFIATTAGRATEKNEANAALIVTAVNAHEELVEALRHATDMLARVRWEHRESIQHKDACDATDAAIGAAIQQARAALAKASPAPECGRRFQEKHGRQAVCKKRTGHSSDCVGELASPESEGGQG